MSETNNASINYIQNQRKLSPESDWYFDGAKEISFTQGNTKDTRVYGVTTYTDVIRNTHIKNKFYGYVTLISGKETKYTVTGTSSTGVVGTYTEYSRENSLGVLPVETGRVVASEQVITSGNYDEELICTYINIPIFREGDTESINNYLNTGDYSNAINQGLLDGSMCDIYLTNNGDRIEFNTVPQKEDAKELLYTQSHKKL